MVIENENLTPCGKVQIIDALTMPKLIFSASLLKIPGGIIKKVNTIVYSFIWGYKDRARYRTVINKMENGGLQMLQRRVTFMFYFFVDCYLFQNN